MIIILKNGEQINAKLDAQDPYTILNGHGPIGVETESGQVFIRCEDVSCIKENKD